MAPPSDSKLPLEILTVLPTDPNKQLEIAHKITSMAVSSRVGELERGVESLKKQLEEKDISISALESRIKDLEHALQKSTSKLASAYEDQVKLEAEKNTLAAKVKKLTRDVEKLEIFRKTLMHSLREDNEDEATNITQKQVTNTDKTSDPGAKSVIPDIGPTNNNAQTSLPFTTSSPTDQSPKSSSPSTSPKASKARSGAASPNGRLSKVSSKWHSIGGGRFSLPASKPSTAPNSPPHVVPQSVPTNKADAKETKIDGKEFFRKVRNRLKYEQFSDFLANIKELNAHRQTREETLKKAGEIFGPENGDLLSAFESLLNRHAPGQEG